MALATSATADIRIFLGKQGSGKTTLAQHQAATFPRVMKFDLFGDDALAAGAYVTEDPRELLHLVQLAGPLQICWRGIEAPGGLFDWGNRAALAAGDLVVLWDEADQLLPAGPVDPHSAAYRIINRGRHHRLKLFATSRRPGRVKRDLMAAATRICAFRTTDELDLKYLQHFMGRDAFRLPTLPAFTAMDWTEAEVMERPAPFL